MSIFIKTIDTQKGIATRHATANIFNLITLSIFIVGLSTITSCSTKTEKSKTDTHTELTEKTDTLASKKKSSKPLKKEQQLIDNRGESIVECAYNDSSFNAKKWMKSDRNQYAKLHPGRVSKYDKVIKRYARRYGFDWRLIAAQIYAESNFNNDAKSYVGAIGLMQVMPTTAKFMGESVTNIRKPEINVMIGCMYDQRMYNLWGRQTKNHENRLAFAIASYNAGRGRVLRSYDTKNSITTWEKLYPTLPTETSLYVHKIFLKYNQYRKMAIR